MNWTESLNHRYNPIDLWRETTPHTRDLLIAFISFSLGTH